jgi:8-oxo-dGTP pyrophosphatase MutT (NUDIX family)
MTEAAPTDSAAARPTGTLRIRQAVRALLITPAHDILMVRFEFPTRQVWALPGGGLDPGENHLTALRRELIEETGLHDPDIGPHIWTREHVIPFVDGTFDGQRDVVHLVHTERFDPEPAIGWEQMRAERVHEMRWWSLDEVTAGSDIGFAPASLPRMLRRLVDHGVPPSPLDTGV